MRHEISLADLQTVTDLHKELAEHLDFGPYYGSNLSALWDVITTEVERPLTIVLHNVDQGRETLGVEFDRLLDVLRRVAEEDTAKPSTSRFRLEIEG